MENSISSSNFKCILHSKRTNIYYLEKCRVMQKDGRVLYLTAGKEEYQYWNIPVANTTVILLGSGTSITQAAMRLLTAAGVMVGFTGGGGTPLLAGTEIEWLSPQSEYRPTQYVQGWLSFWFDEKKRLAVAKEMQAARYRFLQSMWEKDKDIQREGFFSDDEEIEKAITDFSKKMKIADTVTDLLVAEAAFTKKLYKYAAQKTDNEYFVRDADSNDTANKFLNHGNYLAYGLGAVTLWVLGIPHGFAVMHGKTRRGALVFDIADLIKDTVVLPWAFICANKMYSEQEFRQHCLQKFAEYNVLDFMFDEVKKCSELYNENGDGK